MNAEIIDKVVERKIRKSNFELLRIICMLLIIAFHYCTYGNEGTIFKLDISINQIIAIIFGSWGLLGVDCFIFISAYFLIDSSKFSSKKLIKIILQTLFYSICIELLLYLSGVIQFSIKGLIKSVFSPFLVMYWFITAYCMLYVIFPFLNKIIRSMHSKYLLKFLIILTLFIPIYKTIEKSAPIGDFIFVIYLYLLMGYLKQNPQNWFELHAKIGFLITTVCTILFNIIISFFGTLLNLGILQNYASQFIGRYSPIMVLNAIFLFYIFQHMKIKSSKLINTIASTTLGIYLFHENPMFRTILWDGILKINRVYYLPMFIVYFFMSVISLFGIGALIDILRIKLLEEPMFNRKFNYIEIYIRKIDSWMNAVE
jgi:Uncharacterized protein conserved in bacteria